VSRWAETFAALSRGHDTVDTLRHYGKTLPAVSHCVESVTPVADSERAVETPAEAAAECNHPESSPSSSAAKAATVIAPAQWFAADPTAGEPPYDERWPARRGVIRYPQGRFEHFCGVCGAWGAFGFGVTSAAPGRWYCLQHRTSG
jgi:hypothetical protein